ncbi:hypothetical protein ONZ45_g6496 [Pleurotus djamor]|nr:hypothetical protein ONZ45_g6496 [Pleurotus djamor]
MTTNKSNMLDVEDDDARQRRIQIALEKLNKSSSTSVSPMPSFSFGFGSNPNPGQLPLPTPPTELLSRVQAFLPQLEASNALLAQKMQDSPASVDIENITEGTTEYIEMNLGLGVFEQRLGGMQGDMDVDAEEAEFSSSSSSSSSTPTSGPTTLRPPFASSTSSFTSSSSSSDDDNGDYDDYDSDASSEIITCFVPSRPIRPLPRRSLNARPRPQIVVLGD